LENFESASRRLRMELQRLPLGAAPTLLSDIRAVVSFLNAILDRRAAAPSFEQSGAAAGADEQYVLVRVRCNSLCEVRRQ